MGGAPLILTAHFQEEIDGVSRKVRFGSGSSQISGGFVVFSGCLLAGIKGAHPQVIFSKGISDLRSITTPRPLSHASVMHFLGGIDIATLVIDMGLSQSWSHRGLSP